MEDRIHKMNNAESGSREPGAAVIADFSLLLAALMWGAGFIGTQMAIDSGMSFGLIMLVRFMIAAVIQAVVFRGKLTKFNTVELKYGVITGALLFFAFYAQTAGLSYTTPSNNAFFTAVNVVIVPFLSWLFYRKRPEIKSFLCAGLCFAGMVALSFDPNAGLRINPGDMLTLLCAFLFAAHIVAVGIGSQKMNQFKLSFLQVAVAAILSLTAYLLFDLRSFQPEALLKGWPAVVYLGVFCTCVAFFIQTNALKFTTPSRAAILISTESLFGALFSVSLGYERLTVKLLIGGLLIITSVLLIEVKIKKRS